ncbi:tetratricopeptide repeat protein [Thermus filiformis]|uniref:Tetratricopeptide repeat domain protein n=1 Tax=Thermus filiformis TaxID=276 RepID=A0A0A2WRY2_THEFI|nr:tetratricopeptide repeat protein [Thermus filiformis]KGQ22563.2 hypothetical protein THFILI_03665 [Thermus filiformis]
MRALVLLFLLAPALAQGLVLPFQGPAGYRLAQGYAQALQTPPPTLAALLLPEPPWQGGYERAGGLYSRAGAALAREVTGAEFVLLGRTEPLTLYLATPDGVYEGRFSNEAAAWLWLKARLNRHDLSPPPAPQGDEARLQALARGEEPDTLHQAALRLRQGEAVALEGLPQRLLDLWRGFAGKGELPGVYALYEALAQGQKEEALGLARRLAEGTVLEKLGALLVLRFLEDPSWKGLAWRLAEEAPYLPLAWEMASYAAFEEEDGARAKEALLQALRLSPDSALYWTNLGWAEYLLGQKARALSATQRALRLEPGVVALYNLGFLKALYGDHLGAKAAYDRALRLDEEGEVRMAVEDWAKHEKNAPQGLFWRAYLLERAGELGEAKALYQAFLQAQPQSPLAFLAQRALKRLEGARTELVLDRLALIPGDREARPFRVGEAVFPEVRLSGEPYLERAPLTTRLLKDGQVVEKAENPLDLPPLTAGAVATAPAVTPKEEGAYTLEVLYGSARLAVGLNVLKESLARRLYVLGLIPKDLSGQDLLSPQEMLGENGEALLLKRSVEALREAAPLAQSPQLTAPLASGPFPGKSVQELLRNADEALVLAFYRAVLEDPALLGEEGMDLVNAVVSWLLQ